jgi:lipopolysaccharide transport system permease protein
MVGVIDGFRWAIGGEAPLSLSLGTSLAVITIIGVTGLGYFRRTEKSFADII